MSGGIEIERKYLIRMPDVRVLRAMQGCQTWDIEQIYLQSDPDGGTRRVRRIEEEGAERFFYTCKHHINALTQQEDEREITEAEYAEKLQTADPELQPIRKRRLRIPCCGQLLEVDIYPFWKDRAVLEVEMESEDQRIVLPDWVRVIKEVTSDLRYKNNRLAKAVPMDDIAERCKKSVPF